MSGGWKKFARPFYRSLCANGKRARKVSEGLGAGRWSKPGIHFLDVKVREVGRTEFLGLCPSARVEDHSYKRKRAFSASVLIFFMRATSVSVPPLLKRMRV